MKIRDTGPLASLVLLAFVAAGTAGAADDGAGRGPDEAQRAEIVRDEWGIAHVFGKTDADTVFGAIYAQAEDDFPRIERNFLSGLGWLALAEGESAISADLRQRLFVDPQHLKVLYGGSPAWLRALMSAWADSLNYYLATHPAVHPKVITHFEPWMALSFTEGSIGGDIESIDRAKLEEFYGRRTVAQQFEKPTPGGSNGFAVAPARSASGHALLWINPHTSFYFRSELQMVSEQGLNVYGAATWGQFFIYQGFNANNGWMHTSYGGDAIDEYAETIVEKPDGRYYKYGTGLRKFKVDPVRIEYVTPGGERAFREFTVYRSHHGPIVRQEGGKWIAVKLLQTPVPALMQSYLRTKTTDYPSFRKIQAMRTDTSNNTVYADKDGNIAYFHGNFIPKRDPRFDYTHPVDGSDPATEWHGPHALEETISLLNPKNGWIQNTNNWPFSAAGPDSPAREKYPRYMWTAGENPRGVHAAQVLEALHGVTLDTLIAAGYDARLTAFDVLLPPLIAAFDALDVADARRSALQEAVEQLRRWDRRTAADSVPTAVAIFWAQAMLDRKGPGAQDADEPVFAYLVDKTSAAERLAALGDALSTLRRDFGRWDTPWGEINRYQRRTGDIVQPFDDAAPSLGVGLAPSAWGALAAFESAKPRRTKKLYGVSGNSFIAAVEFGPTVHAKALMCGGESGDPASPHFTDQAEMYAQGRFRDVPFTRADVLAHAVRRYHPGDVVPTR